MKKEINWRFIEWKFEKEIRNKLKNEKGFSNIKIVITPTKEFLRKTKYQMEMIVTLNKKDRTARIIWIENPDRAFKLLSALAINEIKRINKEVR